MTATRIVIFAKAPVPGKVKTRLIPALGEAGAARLAHRMLLATVAESIGAGLAVPELCVAPPPLGAEWEGLLPTARVGLTDQGPGNLGERLSRAAKRVIEAGERIIFIGTDCPAMSAERLREAAMRLESFDAVIHPTEDGGYALLGLNRFDASLFSEIAWSTDSVARDTVARIEALGWSLFVGDTLRDVDNPADLELVGMEP